MTPNLHPYPTYKPSGIEWLGDMPAHWEERRISSLGDIFNGATPSTSVPEYWNGDISWLTPEDLGQLRGRYISDGARRITAKGYESCGTVLAPAGSIAISTRAPIGHLGVLLSDACVNQGCRLLSLNSDVQSEYLYYTLLTSRPYLQSYGEGSTFTELSRTKLAGFRIPLPPLAEQAAIVRYLDDVDDRIQRYIASKERLIELLAERKQAVVNRAVTRGLDPSVPLKSSGVDWLGDVPAHWEVRRMRNISDMRFSNVDKHVKSDEVPVELCNYVDVYKNDRINSDMEFMSATARMDEIERFRLEIGDVLITKDSEAWDDIAVPALVESLSDNLVCGYHLALLRPYSNIMGSYLFRCLQVRSIEYQFHVEAKGVTRYGLSQNAIASVLLPVPSLAEQAAIVEYLDRATTGIDAAMTRARRQIELMQEYRTRLIADVVTGKVDVRGEVADGGGIAIP